MPTESIDIGFRIRLKDFERKLDPGTSQASHYSSWVDFVDLKNTQEIWTVSSAGGQAQSLGVPTRATPEDAKPQVLHQFVSGYAVDGDTIYWLDRDNRKLQSTDIQSGETSTLLDNDKIGLLTGDEASNAFLNSPRNLQLQGETLFWVDELGGTSVIQSVQTNGNSPTRVVHSLDRLSN